jgi:hypothetical protein
MRGRWRKKRNLNEMNRQFVKEGHPNHLHREHSQKLPNQPHSNLQVEPRVLLRILQSENESRTRKGKTSTHGSELEEAPPNRPTKRAGRNGKAKAPLTIPKTSKGYTSHQTHRMRGNSAAESEGLEKAVDACRSSPVNRATNTTESEQPKPRKRGRPPKNRNLPSEAVQHDAIPTPKKTQPADHAVAKSTVTANRPGIALQAPGDLDGGISGILLNPSPIKVVRPEVQQAAPTAQHQKSPKPKDRVMTTNGVSEISDDEYELEDDDGNAEANADISDEIEAEDDQGATGQSSNQAQKTPFHPQLIDKMWETSNHVGKKFDIKEQTWSQGGKVQKLLTIPGKRIIRRLNRMISSYENMQNSKESQDKRGFRDAHTEVENIFETLVEETNAILTERFRPGYDTEKVEATLIDLYFNIIPEGIHVLKKAVAVFNIEGSMNTAALQEILRLVDLLYDLANAAVTQPKEIQPRPAGSISYQISQPTRYNLPTIRKLQKLILAELTFREREKERAKEELLRPERERRLREEQEREDSEISRKRDERRRMQGEFWRAVQNNFFPHPWNRVLETDIARLEAARKGKGRQESVELGNPRMRMVEPRRPNSEESRPGSDQGVERVSVFPANNVKVNSSMSSLSKEDTLIFIDCMRYEQGKVNSLS